MRYYSTNKKTPHVSLQEAVVNGLAKDKGLFMPEKIASLPSDFFKNIANKSFIEIACTVANAFFGDDVEKKELNSIVENTLNFDTPLVKVTDRIYSLELYHGPTLAFKDVGARFMSRLLGYFIKKQGLSSVNVLVATSGDTGSAVANGFVGVHGIHVFVLYPKGLVSKIQESQFTTLGQNITAIEVDGTFDDCQRLVKTAFSDSELTEKKQLTSANSINVSRLLPQSFYYFYAYAQLIQKNPDCKNIVVCVPSGNFGNITAGLIAKKMGLPIKRFIAANNRNDIFLQYLRSGQYNPHPSIATIANAMDVGDPSNFARIIDLYGSHKAICSDIDGCSYNNSEIAQSLKQCFEENNYLLDPHGACGYRALKEKLQADETGIFLETAHPAKFKSTVEQIIGNEIQIPTKLQDFIKGEKQTVPMSKRYEDFKAFLTNHI